ncbi:MAG: hypothetical protein Q8L87_15400 [Anaerolineales bacterium]|nr:hypothetical protein [Anaerolineales bacterium]
MTTKARIAKLEKTSGAGDKKFYTCVIHEDEDTGGGYEVKPVNGEPLHFATRKELDEFGARPGVDLLIIRIVAASEADA